MSQDTFALGVDMSITLDTLLALKAFQIGAAAAISPQREMAHSMLNCAIDQLEQRAGPENKLRLAFYLATRSELLRGSPQSIVDRAAAMTVSRLIGSDFFDSFMRVEEATLSRTVDRIAGSTSPYSGGGGTDMNPDNPFVSMNERTHRTLRAVGGTRLEMSPKDRAFLERATLIEILEKHGISYAP